jgi:hypothetical protein
LGVLTPAPFFEIFGCTTGNIIATTICTQCTTTIAPTITTTIATLTTTITTTIATAICCNARFLPTTELVDLANQGDERTFMNRIEELTMEALTNREKARGKCMARDERGNTLLMIAAAKGHVELTTRLLTHWQTLDPEFDADERKVWYVQVNARDNKGWNATSVAAFHCQCGTLRVLLAHGGDPTTRNVYGKNAFWFGQDELHCFRSHANPDGNTMVVTDRSEVRQVLNEWENTRVQQLMDAGASKEEVALCQNVAVVKVDDKTVAGREGEVKNGEEVKEATKELGSVDPLNPLDPLAMEKEDLKTALKQRKMDTKGKKKELVKRLTEVLLKEKKQAEKKNQPLVPSKMKLQDVRMELKNRKLDSKGNKDNLVKRLEDALKKEKKKKKKTGGGKAGSGKKKTSASKYAVAVKK